MASESSRGASKRNRTAMSCDRCKSRKTKCNNPVPGPCDYCASIGASCQIDIGKRKQRPYYFVSEEQFRLMSKLLKHIYPDDDLDLPNLRDIVARLDSKAGTASVASKEDDFSSSAGAITPAPSQSLQPRLRNEGQSQESVALDEIDSLHEDLGCILRDTTGEYRYMGPVSGISFNAAVRDLNPGSLAAKLDKDIIPPMITTILPPVTPETSATALPHHQILLPSRTTALRYIGRYFDQVHCLYWLYSSEQFHMRLDETYTSQRPQSASWVCSLYSIFSLGSQISSPVPDAGAHTPEDYLAMAKSLVTRVYDEADLDSVRALILLALALSCQCFTTSAYIQTAVAVRIAFSLGMHVDKFSLAHGYVEREHARRIWWTLFIFDQEIALRSGKPCAISPQGPPWQPTMPSEQVLNPGPTTPSGYLEVSASLTQLTKNACQTMYPDSQMGKRKLLSLKVVAVLSSLQEWAKKIPSHLSRTNHVAPSQKRAVALLHVRYWSVVILATRIFLLSTVLRPEQIHGGPKKRCYEELSRICMDAAQNSVMVLKMMSEEGLLSSLVSSEFLYVLELVQISLVAFQRTRSDQHIRNARTCSEVLRSLEDVGWTKRARPEVMLQLKTCGIVSDGAETTPDQMQDFTNFLMGAESAVDVSDMILPSDQNVAGAQQHVNWAEMDFGDAAASEEFYRQIAQLSRMPHFETP